MLHIWQLLAWFHFHSHEVAEVANFHNIVKSAGRSLEKSLEVVEF